MASSCQISGVGLGLGGGAAVGGTAVWVGGSSVGSGKGVLVAGMVVVNCSVGAAGETAVACGTAVSAQLERKRVQLIRKKATRFCQSIPTLDEVSEKILILPAFLHICQSVLRIKCAIRNRGCTK